MPVRNPTPPRRRRPVRVPASLLERIESRVLFADFSVTNTLDAGPGSLRAAIESANLTPGADTISFNIAGGGAQTIAPLTGLPVVTEAVTIDATTQPGFGGTPLVTLDGVSVVGSSGLRLSGGASTVRGLRVTRFSSNGLAIDTAGGNVVQGNEIVGNLVDGISVASSNNTIGGTAVAQRNVITGNGRDGMRVTAGATGNQIIGNRVGVDAAGAATGNGMTGVTLFGAGNSVTANVISDNNEHGVQVSGASASNNVIQGNLIGTDATGTAALGNGQSGVSGTGGVRILSANGTIVGGTSAGAGNVISGNFAEGILIEGLGAGGTIVQGNFIGTNASGTAALPNVNDGIQIKSGSHTIGGTTAGVVNVLSGNGDDGIEIQSVNSGGNIVQGNRIGTNAAGTAALGNGSDGVEIQGSSGNQIGGSAVGAGNVIAANASDGIEILGDTTGGSSGNAVTANVIGVGTGGQALGNTRNGVNLEAANGTVVSDNTIANNALDGVFVNSGATGNPVRQNAIHSNGGLGIDLGLDGVTPNDAGDADAGANDLQNFPTITSATTGAGGTVVSFTINSTPNAQVTVDVYSGATADPSGFGEGATWGGATTLTTDAAGNATGSVNVGNVAAGLRVSATATNAQGSTSEFSQSVPVTDNDTVAPAVNASNFLFDGATLPAAPHRLTYAFSENVSASLGAGDLLLENLSTGATVPAANIAVSYNAATNTATFTFPGFTNGVLPDGRYRATLLAAGVTDPAGNPLAANHVSEFFVLAADANHDGSVNLGDFNVLAANFGQSPRNFTQGDFDYSGTVNLADFNILASRFGMVLTRASVAGRSGSAPTATGADRTIGLTDGQREALRDLLN